MGELLAFSAHQKVSRHSMTRAEGAEILFFTGVRYARLEDYEERSEAARLRQKTADTKRRSSAAREKKPCC